MQGVYIGNYDNYTLIPHAKDEAGEVTSVSPSALGNR